LIFVQHRHPPTHPLFPYTTLFRSRPVGPDSLGEPGAVPGVTFLLVHRAGNVRPAVGDALPAGAAGEPEREPDAEAVRAARPLIRSEEHTSELQSRENLVCRLLLEK